MWQLVASSGFWVELLRDAIVAGLAVLLGAAFVVRRIRKERAFDRRLEWHASTLKATSRFSHLSKEYRSTLINPDTFLSQDRIIELAKELESCASDLRTTSFDAVLFAEKRAVKQLTLLFSEIEELITLARNVVSRATDTAEFETEYTLLDKLKALDNVLAALHVSLARNIRKQLRLDKLTDAELAFGPEPSRREQT